MSTECGAVTSFFATPERGQELAEVEEAAGPYLDSGSYAGDVEVDIGALDQPLIAWPEDPFNLHPLSESAGIPINYSMIGTCSGGGLTGMREAAEVLRGRKVHDAVTMLIVPQSQGVYLSCLREGLIETFVSAGAVVTTPTCGPCLASHSGVLSRGDVCVTTGNRNYRGRMGDPRARIYLSSPRVASLAAIQGRFCWCEEGYEV